MKNVTLVSEIAKFQSWTTLELPLNFFFSILMYGLPPLTDTSSLFHFYYWEIFPYITPYVFPISITVQTASAYMTLCVTIERWVAVCHPLKAILLFNTFTCIFTPGLRPFLYFQRNWVLSPFFDNLIAALISRKNKIKYVTYPCLKAGEVILLLQGCRFVKLFITINIWIKSVEK